MVTEEVIRQYPQYPEFLRAKRQMDPCNAFSNAFSDSILFPGKGEATTQLRGSFSPAAPEAAAAAG